MFATHLAHFGNSKKPKTKGGKGSKPIVIYLQPNIIQKWKLTVTHAATQMSLRNQKLRKKF